MCNTRFHGLWCDVSCGDSLERVKYQQYEGIICEPPMPVFSLTEKSKDGKVKRNRQTEFVNLILNSLSPNNESRAALLLPESFFWVSTADYHNMRRRLFEDHDVYAILRLPKGIYNGSSISMCALFLYRNKNNGKKVLVYDMQSDKLDLETVNTCADNIFNGFKKAFWNGKLDKKSSFLSLNEIKDEGYRVSFQTGGAKEQKSVEDPSHYLAEANKIVKDIRILLSKIERELND